MKRTVKPTQYVKLLGDIKERIRAAPYEALKAVNKALIALYWAIGKMNAGRQKGSTWGRSVVQKLVADLRSDFPGIKGFSASGLWRMRNFYLADDQDKKPAPMVREISWPHNSAILEKCEDRLEREFDICMTRWMGWSKNRCGEI